MEICVRGAHSQRVFIRLPMLIPLFILSLALILISNLRLGFSVEVGDWSSGEIYSLSQISRAISAAEAAAGEILCDDCDMDSLLKTKIQLTTASISSDTYELERKLLEAAPGIISLYAVKIDGETVGWVSDFSELAESLDAMLAQETTIYTISAGVNKLITLESGFAPADTDYNVEHLMPAIRSFTEVQVVELDPDEAIEVSS